MFSTLIQRRDNLKCIKDVVTEWLGWKIMMMSLEQKATYSED